MTTAPTASARKQTVNAVGIACSALLEHKPKLCRKCGLQKPICKGRAICVQCRNKEAALWAKRNPEKRRQISNAYARKHRKEAAERSKQWAKANREKANASSRRYYWRNPERKREAARLWSKKHPEKRLATWRARYEKQKPEMLAKCQAWIDAHPGWKAASHQRQKNNLTDGYIRKLLVERTGLGAKHVPQELVELKRTIIKLERICQNQKTSTT